MINRWEATELLEGTLMRKGPWFKFRLKIYLHKIDRAIEHAAEHRNDELTVNDIPDEYIELIRQKLESANFDVRKGWGNSITITWGEK